MKNFLELKETIPVQQRYDDKYFRAKRLLDEWYVVDNKLFDMLRRGLYKKTHTAKCAWAILVMMKTGIRVGNENSAEGYLCVNAYSDKFNQRVKTYGITTLLRKHCIIEGGKLILDFVGKKLVKQNFIVDHNYLIETFKWLFADRQDDDVLIGVTHYELTKFVKKYIGKKYSVKDIRTARVNYVFIDVVRNYEKVAERMALTKKSEANKFAGQMVEMTAEKIGHTKQVCKSRYISPNLFNYYKGYLYELLQKNKESS